MARSRADNRELGLSVRSNGRIIAAFHHYHLAEAFAYSHKANWPDSRVEIIDEYGSGNKTMLSLGPVEK